MQTLEVTVRRPMTVLSRGLGGHRMYTCRSRTSNRRLTYMASPPRFASSDRLPWWGVSIPTGSAALPSRRVFFHDTPACSHRRLAGCFTSCYEALPGLRLTTSTSLDPVLGPWSHGVGELCVPPCDFDSRKVPVFSAVPSRVN